MKTQPKLTPKATRRLLKIVENYKKIRFSMLPATTFRLTFLATDGATLRVSITHVNEERAKAAVTKFYDVDRFVSVRCIGKVWLGLMDSSCGCQRN